MSETIFHKILRGEIPSARIYEDDWIYAFMDAFPQTRGHALIIAKQGGGENLLTTDEEALSRIIRFSKKLAHAQMKVFQPDGIRVMQFNGEAAGQTVFYYHMHLIPAWKAYQGEAHGAHLGPFDGLVWQANQLAEALEL